MMRDTEREYEKLPGGERQKFRLHATFFLSEKKKDENRKRQTDPRVTEVKKAFVQYCENIRGFTPRINHAVEGAIIKRYLKDYSVDEITDCFDWYMNHDNYQNFACSIKTILGNGIWNKWLQER
jgi:hypothetical protein